LADVLLLVTQDLRNRVLCPLQEFLSAAQHSTGTLLDHLNIVRGALSNASRLFRDVLFDAATPSPRDSETPGKTYIVEGVGAGGGNRTPTPLRAQDFKNYVLLGLSTRIENIRVFSPFSLFRGMR
jgi:hypothetical protein